MPSARKYSFSKMLDLPFGVAVVLTAAFYLFVTHDSMKDSLLNRYTTEHIVEYVIVAFFIWGLSDVAFRAAAFPRELLALRQEWLPRRTAREPASHAAVLHAHLTKKAKWLQESRIGQRLMQGLAHVREKGSADEFSDYLRYLADHDYEKIQNNYSLVRFICWVTPMFGFLGTVVHFGTALGGKTAGDISDKLPTVVAEMGTAFNTTTVALTAATTMMFALFLCERTERGIVNDIDRRAERELANRFEVVDANMAPFLGALEATGRVHLRTMETMVERQLEIWSSAFQKYEQQAQRQQQLQVQVWVEALEKLDERFETSEASREGRLARVIESLEQHREQIRTSVEHVSGLQSQFSQLVESLNGMSQGREELISLQASLADNLRLLQETQQIDQALHGLTAAIHLMTARGQGTSQKELRAA